MRLSIVIPVYNEEKTISEIIRRVLDVPLPPGIDREVVVVNDCSKDGTLAVLESLRRDNVRVFSHPVNRGKGAALRTGFAQCQGDVVLIQDADLEYDPMEYPTLLRPILENGADVVFGSRFKGEGASRVLYFWHMVANKLLTLASNVFTDMNLTDMETCYKVIRTPLLRKIKLEEDRFGFEPEITAKIANIRRKEHIAIYEVGVSYHGRTYSDGKKIGLKDAFRALYCIVKYNVFG